MIKCRQIDGECKPLWCEMQKKVGHQGGIWPMESSCGKRGSMQSEAKSKGVWHTIWGKGMVNPAGKSNLKIFGGGCLANKTGDFASFIRCQRTDCPESIHFPQNILLAKWHTRCATAQCTEIPNIINCHIKPAHMQPTI